MSGRLGENQHVGFTVCSRHHRVLRRRCIIRAGLRQIVEGGIIMVDYVWTGLVAVLLLCYLVYALLKPERF
jgi:K+-transporting ATPase KdpF subunit